LDPSWTLKLEVCSKFPIDYNGLVTVVLVYDRVPGTHQWCDGTPTPLRI